VRSWNRSAHVPTTRHTGQRRLLVLLLGLCLALAPFAVAPAAADVLPDPENPTAVLEISKEVSDTEVGPGDLLVYTIEVSCSAISDVGCRDAITTDVIPEPFVIETVTTAGDNDAAEPVIDGQNVTVTWTEDIDGAKATRSACSTTPRAR
jgi:hypothetical protein